MVQNPNVLVRNLIEKEGVVFNEATASASQQDWTYEGNFKYLLLHYNKVANGGALIIRDKSNNYADNNATGNVKVYDMASKEELMKTLYFLSINDSFPSDILIDARFVKGIRVYITAGAAGQLSITKINNELDYFKVEEENEVSVTNIPDNLSTLVPFLEKEGVLLDGQASSATNYTYTGDFQYLDIDFTPEEGSGVLYIRDNGDNYATNNAKLIKVIDKDTGIVYPGGQISFTLYANREYHLRVDARNAEGVRLIVQANVNGRICVQKVFTSDADGEGIKFVDIVQNPSTGLIISSQVDRHKSYAVAKLTTKSDDATVEIFDGVSGNKGNTPFVYSRYGFFRTDLYQKTAGTEYYLIDITNLSRFNVYWNSSNAAKIESLSVFFTNDLELARRISGVLSDTTLVDIISNQTYNQFTFIPLNNKRYYVVYLDFISGTLGLSSTATLSLFSGSSLNKITRYDGKTTGIYNFNFASIGELKSGYYIVDLSNVDIKDNNTRFNFSNNLSDLELRIVHIGQFNEGEISQFMQIPEVKLACGNGDFELKYLDHKMHYALDDYWIEYNNTDIVLCKDDKLYTVALSSLGWRKHNIGQEHHVKLIHPTYDAQTGYGTKMMLVLEVEDSSQSADDHASEWWVCEVTNPENIYTKANWTKCKFWEKKDSARKIPTKDSSVVDSYHRYDTTLPDSYYNYDDVSADGHHIEYQGTPILQTLRGFGCHAKKITLYGSYEGNDERPCLWATTDDGYNFVAIYDFVGMQAKTSDNINTSGFSNYSSGLTLSKVTLNTPTAANKEPEHKYTITELSGWTIVKGAETVINFSNNHGLYNGGIVAFTGDAGVEWNQLRTNELTADSLGDNVYMVVVNSTTQITLKPYNGSYENSLKCRHIHSVNESKSGFVFATGEMYPFGWIMFMELKNRENDMVLDAMTEDFHFYRFNSSENSLQRACGVIMYEDTNDPTILVNSDYSLADTGIDWTIQGRTNLPSSSSAGIWKGKLSDIDDYSKFECLLDIPDSAIWAFRYSGLVVCYYQTVGIAISKDDGKTFTYYPYYDGVRLLIGTYRGKIVMSEGYVLDVKK